MSLIIETCTEESCACLTKASQKKGVPFSLGVFFQAKIMRAVRYKMQDRHRGGSALRAPELVEDMPPRVARIEESRADRS